MNPKPILALILILALSLLPGSVRADTPVSVDQNWGFRDVATPSFDCASSTATNIGALLPLGCKGFMLYSYNGATVIGPTSDLTVGAEPVGIVIASGSYVTWTGINPDGPTALMNIYGRANQAGSTNCRLVAW